MPVICTYDYAIIRVVPRIERGECINVGVILFCPTRRFLAARVELQTERLLALAPDLDLPQLRQELEHLVRVCQGGRTEAEAGPIGQLSPSERFHWLVAPRSTIIQSSPVHSGLCTDPSATLEHLLRKLVL